MKKLGKTFLPLIGYGYGRKKHRPDEAVDKKAGQEFWKLLTQEDDFYLRISDAIAKSAGEHKLAFEQAYEINRASLVKIGKCSRISLPPSQMAISLGRAR